METEDVHGEKVLTFDVKGLTHSPGGFTRPEEHLPRSRTVLALIPQEEKKTCVCTEFLKLHEVEISLQIYLNAYWKGLYQHLFMYYFMEIFKELYFTKAEKNPDIPNETYHIIMYSPDMHLARAHGVLCVVTWVWDTHMAPKSVRASAGQRCILRT